MKIAGGDIRPGFVIEHEGGLWAAVKTQNVKPGKGGAYLQVELKNLLDGRKTTERFRTSETLERVELERKDFQLLFIEGGKLTFMDTETFDQLELDEDFVGERTAFLQDNMTVIVELHDGRPIGIQLPEHVTLKIVEADPVIKGQTAASSYKSAVLENGLKILVPPHVEAGTRVVVATDDGAYVRRAD